MRSLQMFQSMGFCLQAVKYGVVSTSALLRDLWNWDSFYVAGRLHKPVLFLVRDADIDRAAAVNMDAAFAAALLLLPARFTAKVPGLLMRCVGHQMHALTRYPV